MSSSSSGTQIVPGMKGVYDQLLGLNVQNYGNVLNSYAGANANLNAALPGIYQGYGNIQDQLIHTLGLAGGGYGVAEPAAKDIQRTFQQSNARSQQQAINAGLGNSTVLASMNRGNASEAGRSYANLGAQLANLGAGVQERTGMALQQARLQGLGMQTGLGQSLGSTLAGYHFANTAGGLTGGYSNAIGEGGGLGGGHGGYGGGGGIPSSPADGSMFFAGGPSPIAPPSASGMGYWGGYTNQGYYPGYGGSGGGSQGLNLGGGGLQFTPETYPEF